MQPQGIALALNIGSGQRRFHSTSDVEWVNIDCVSRPPEQVPDLVCDVGKESLPIPNDHADYCVLHHVYEHFGLGEGHPVIRECHRVLKPGGILILTVPDMRALAMAWLRGRIEDYTYFVNVYGAYQGLETDRHKWGYDYQALFKDMKSLELPWREIHNTQQRQIPGASIARDFWILEMELIK